MTDQRLDNLLAEITRFIIAEAEWKREYMENLADRIRFLEHINTKWPPDEITGGRDTKREPNDGLS